MIERGSGRTSGLTDWRLMDVLSMWACLQDQDTAGQWKQVAGWRKVCDLALTHLSRLREYRRGLAEAWPPETNAAARAYIAELDQLIDRVQRTHDAAAANYDALAAATRAIGSARAELQPLHEEYEKRLRQKRAYEATIADPKAVAGSRLPERPPVTDDDLEQLNVRARGLMTGLSGELQHAQVMLQRPPTPVGPGRPGRQVNDPDTYDQAPPIIPPVVPVQVSGSSGKPSPRNPAVSPVETKPLTPPISGVGPILGAAAPGTAQAPPEASAPPIKPTSPTTPSIGAQAGFAPTGSMGPVSPRPPAPPSGPNLPFNDPNRTSPGGSGRQALPNGFIGTPTGGSIGQPTPNNPRRVNPIGGVIGGGAGTAPSGAAGSRPGAGRTTQPGASYGNFPVGGSPSAASHFGTRNRREHDGEGTPLWDADHPWRTNRGVDPVMLPPEEDGPIDPGPAIGFNR